MKHGRNVLKADGTKRRMSIANGRLANGRFDNVAYLIFCATLLFLWPNGRTAAQTSFHVGVHGAWLRSWHETVQAARTDEGGCGEFTRANGTGFTAGLHGEVEILPWLRGTTRLSFARLGATLATQCDNGIIVPTGRDNEFAPLVREYRKDVRLDYGLVELGVRVLPMEFPLYLSAGLQVGAPIFGSDWAQDERIVSPEGVLFPGNVLRRSNGAAEFSDTQLRSAVTAGIGLALPMADGMEFSPEIGYSYPLSDATTGYDWKISSFTAGASLTWRFTIDETTPPPVEAPPPPSPPLPQPPIARIGTTSDAAIDITETFVTETFPLLPYVFFEKNSAELAGKYRTSRSGNTASFTEAALPRKTMPIYYHLLDIMGARLQKHPDARITLMGSTDDKDAEAGNTELARQRAEAVKSYFVDVWGVDSARITVRTQRLPLLPSSVLYPEGDEENRRVEILSESDELFRPVVHERLSEFDITPPTLEMTLGSESTSPVLSWAFTVYHDNRAIADFRGEGAPPATLQWRVDDAVAALVRAEDRLDALLTIESANGLSAAAKLDIPVRKRQNSFEVGRLSLIVFDFDRSDILPHNRRMIRRFVAEAIKPSSSVSITGSTDRLGELEHNMELSSARAENVKEILLSQNPRYQRLESRGIGEAPLLYDNNLPEGRFYCRTVAVEVQTPVETR